MYKIQTAIVIPSTAGKSWFYIRLYLYSMFVGGEVDQPLSLLTFTEDIYV